MRARRPRRRSPLPVAVAAASVLLLAYALLRRRPPAARPKVPVPLTLVVEDAAGRPIAGARVRFFARHQTRAPALSVATDARGRAVLPAGRAAGDFHALVEAPGGLAAATFLYGYDAAPNVLRLAPAAPIEGTVLGPDGKPQAGAEVALRIGGHRAPILALARSGAGGRFRFEHVSLEHEVLHLEVRAKGAAELRTVLFRSRTEQAVLRLAKERPLRFLLLGPGGKPLAGVPAHIAGDPTRRAVSDARGLLTFHGLPLDEAVLVRFEHPSLTYATPKRRRPGGRRRTVRFARPITVAGRLLDAAGRGLAGHRIVHFEGPRAPVAAETGPGGRFELGDLPPGRREFLIVAPDGSERKVVQEIRGRGRTTLSIRLP